MAEFKVAAVFSDHMVLQREKCVKVFGEGEDGQVVTVTFEKTTVGTKVSGERWEVILPPMEAGTGYEMTVSCGDYIRTYGDIAIGEVWLAGGQSNMEFELQNCIGGKEYLKNDTDCNVRFYYTQKNAYMDEAFYEQERNSGWDVFDEEKSRAWSAVGYIFAKRIAKELGVTVGIIGCNWGGTSASTWMSKEALTEDKELNSYVEEYDKAIEGKSVKQQIEEYDKYSAYQAAWDIRCGKCYAENPKITWDEVLKICGENQYPGPMNCKNPLRPAGLYECMLKRVMPYTLRGFLFYQGESDDHKPRMYYKLFKRMIEQWRDDWEDDTLPMLMVQLPMHRYAQDPDYKHWPIIREAQMRTFQTVKNTGIAVILDCGEFNEIHPKDKVPVGERLALQAMYQVYHIAKEEEAFGPIYHSCVARNGRMELSFEHAEHGFYVKGEPSGFEIAGVDKQFVPAKAEIDGKQIYVSSEQVPNPMYVRYCWTNYSDVTIFGANKLPLAPFRTSRNDEINLDSVNHEVKIQQVMEL